MGNKKRYQRQLKVQLKYVPAPDSDGGLSRTIGILLRAAARGTTKSEDSIKGKKGPAGDNLTGGEETVAHE